MDPGVLAHGGTAGAVAETAFVLAPIAVFAVLARVSRRRREREQAEADAEAAGDAAEVDPEKQAP